VSGHPQDTWISDWDLICDAEGSCVLTFTDIRSGNWDVQAYKITSDGAFAWGADGINLSQSAAFEPSPAVCQAGDGDYVFAWGQYPDAGGGRMMMQRLAPDGALRFAVGGISVISVGTEEPGFPDLEPSLGGDVLLMYVRDISAYISPRHIRLQRFTAAGPPSGQPSPQSSTAVRSPWATRRISAWTVPGERSAAGTAPPGTSSVRLYNG